jgi:hypothetical protein
MLTRTATGAAERVDQTQVVPRAEWDVTSWWAAGGGAVAGALLFLVAHHGILDDGYITLSYARTLAFHGSWGLTEFRTANTATSPLNVWLLALGTLVTRRPVVALGLVLVASTAVTAGWLSTIAARVGVGRWLLPALGLGLLVVNPLFASTVGMEIWLGVAVLVGVGRYALDGRSVATGVLCGLAVLTRPDLVVPAGMLVVGLLALGAPRRLRVTGMVAGVAALVALPWHMFSWFVLGGFVPDTFAIKTAAGQFGPGETFATGPYFIAHTWTRAFLLIAVPVVVGLAAMLAWAVAWCRGVSTLVGRATLVFGAAGAAHYGAYALVGVPPHHWYYTPSAGLLTICAAITVAAIAHRAFSLILVSAGLLVGLSAGTQLAVALPWDKPILYGNWATSQQYAAVGQGVGRLVPRGETVGGFGEIGTVAFFCDCDIIDPFTDRSKALEVEREREAKAGPVMRALLAVNYAHLDKPPPTRIDHQLEYAQGEGPGWRTVGPTRGVGHIWLSR